VWLLHCVIVWFCDCVIDWFLIVWFRDCVIVWLTICVMIVSFYYGVFCMYWCTKTYTAEAYVDLKSAGESNKQAGQGTVIQSVDLLNHGCFHGHIHSFAHSFIHWFTHSHIYPPGSSLSPVNHSVIQSFTHSHFNLFWHFYLLVNKQQLRIVMR